MLDCQFWKVSETANHTLPQNDLRTLQVSETIQLADNQFWQSTGSLILLIFNLDGPRVCVPLQSWILTTLQPSIISGSYPLVKCLAVTLIILNLDA